MKIQRTLREALSTQQVVPFVGAGVSMAVRDKKGQNILPSWRELLERAASRLVEENKRTFSRRLRAYISKNDYLEAAKYAKEKLASRWLDFLREELNPDIVNIDRSSLSLAKSIWKLGSSLVLTTNYDPVLRWSCPELPRLQTWDIVVPASYREILRGYISRPTIWHIHGHIDAAHNMILTPDGYNRLYNEDPEHPKLYKGALQTLRYLLAIKTMVFIGFSLQDKFLLDQIRWAKDTFEDTLGPHFALVEKGELDRVADIVKDLPIEPLTFSGFGKKQVSLVLSLARHTRSSQNKKLESLRLIKNDETTGNNEIAQLGNSTIQTNQEGQVFTLKILVNQNSNLDRQAIFDKLREAIPYTTELSWASQRTNLRPKRPLP